MSGLRAVFMLAAVWLAGCQADMFNPSPNEDTPLAPSAAPAAASTEPMPAGLLALVTAGAPGQSNVVQDAAGRQWRVTLGREYFSAAGLTCRRLTMAAPGARDALSRAACHDAIGWHLDPIAVSVDMPSAR
jgi:hypothetical protein